MSALCASAARAAASLQSRAAQPRPRRSWLIRSNTIRSGDVPADAAGPDGWRPAAGAWTGAVLAETGPGPDARPHIYVCGPTPFVEAVADALVGLGHDPATVRTERFGPTGG
jgi:hypothetical protein